MTPELAEEIRQVLENPRFEAYWQPRVNLFLGRWIRHGGFLSRPQTALVQARHGAHGGSRTAWHADIPAPREP